jgi:uncharacterized protein YjbJ (UPF0337 family)
MKSSARDKVEGKMHQAKGTLKEVAGRMDGDIDLEAEGKEEHLNGKVQEKVGQVKKAMGK